MARVYSSQFLDDSPASGVTVTATVPAGHVWVIRCVDLFCSVPGSSTPNGFTVWMGGARPIWQRGAGQTLYFHLYSWRGRQVLNAGQDLAVQVNDDNWQVMASGYDLTTP